MRATGIVRQLDDLNRLVIPKELCKEFGLNRKSPMEIYTEKDGSIILKKYERGCIFCGETKDVTEFKDKPICKKCRAEVRKI